MYGNFVEAMIQSMETMRSSTKSAIDTLAYAMHYQMHHYNIFHAGCGTGPCEPVEKPHPLTFNPMTPINIARSTITSNMTKMYTLESVHFAGSTYENYLGSPWYELHQMDERISAGNAYVSTVTPFNWLGDKAGMMGILNSIMTQIIDAKYPIIIYHDYIQRGYDHIFNGNSPNITYQTTLDGSGMGTIPGYSENVNLPDSSNPYDDIKPGWSK